LFAYHEHKGKRRVRNAPADMTTGISHNANMAKKASGPTDYEALRQASGWYAAAWRDYRGITQQDLADEIGSSRGQISDLETGAKTRFNRDWVEKFGRALNVTGGRLIDVNPFALSERLERLSAVVTSLDDEGQEAMLDMAERWAKRTGTEG
jgi:transcriptional regulator with XRE-family HTH domain